MSTTEALMVGVTENQLRYRLSDWRFIFFMLILLVGYVYFVTLTGSVALA